jgi:tripartite-type tricarboxylate transporter receptor subunit TctC
LALIARRTALALVAGSAAQPAAAGPDRPVRIVVPVSAGSVPDVVARLLAERLAPRWSVPVVVDNRPGASGAIGVEAALRATPDGHTLLMGSSGPIAILPAMSRHLSYDPPRDLLPLGRVADFALVVVAAADAGLRDFAGLLSRTRGAQAPLNYAGGDVASTQHMAGALLAELGGLRLNHVPYRSSLAQADLLAGRIPLMIDSLTAVLGLIRDGRAIPLAVCGARRSPQVKDVPTVAEAGIAGYEATGWMGVFGPARMPAGLAAELSAALGDVLREPATAQRIAAAGSDPAFQEGPAFGRFIADETAKWRRLGKRLGISLD